MNKENILEIRKTEYDVNILFPTRWSARAMSGKDISKNDLMSLFEAARWAPSSYNEQPWRFLYAKKDSQTWKNIFSTLVEFNQLWTKNSSYLIVIISKDIFDKNNKENFYSQFDTGAAWQNLALQGSLKVFVVHAMGGFDKEALSKKIDLPEGHTIQAVVAVGLPADKSTLPNDIEKMESPSGRKKIEEIAFENEFKR
jgi:nitroreductase